MGKDTYTLSLAITNASVIFDVSNKIPVLQNWLKKRKGAKEKKGIFDSKRG